MKLEALTQWKPSHHNAAQLDALLSEAIREDEHKIVVLDDDPTGVQTVHGVFVYTNWDMDSIRSGFQEKNKLFYILTNSRGLTNAETTQIHREIADRVDRVAAETSRPYFFISRSDSTLRGHFPAETEAIQEELEKRTGVTIDGEILCPFFKEGGRLTIDGTHYVQYGDELMPAAETEFAQDKTFGFSHSYLPAYIQEKTTGRFLAESVVHISLSLLRNQDFDAIERLLQACEQFQKVCVDAIDEDDLKVFAIAVYRCMKRGKRFLFRSAASLVKVLGGITTKSLLTFDEMIHAQTQHGGMVVVGSHTAKTTRQLAELLQMKNTVPISFQSGLVRTNHQAFEQEITRCVKEAEGAIRQGKVAVCFTERELLPTANMSKEDILRQSVMISEGVQKLVALLSVCPSFIVAKGGITSSDIGTKALCVRRAEVMGQIIPGVPVWKAGPESRFPDIPYIIFPGNVGEDHSLREAVSKLIPA